MAKRQTVDSTGCADMIRVSPRVVALTGAGISTSAGVPDFRGPEGLNVHKCYGYMANVSVGRVIAAWLARQ